MGSNVSTEDANAVRLDKLSKGINGSEQHMRRHKKVVKLSAHLTSGRVSHAHLKARGSSARTGKSVAKALFHAYEHVHQLAASNPASVGEMLETTERALVCARARQLTDDIRDAMCMEVVGFVYDHLRTTCRRTQALVDDYEQLLDKLRVYA